jgi:ribonucleoside-diphosphate reductase alpha chain
MDPTVLNSGRREGPGGRLVRARRTQGGVYPRGGGWIDGRYVPSLLAAIGGVIERPLAGDVAVNADAPLREVARAPVRPGAACPRCSGLDLARKEGCDT